jgi:hypothetical protein
MQKVKINEDREEAAVDNQTDEEIIVKDVSKQINIEGSVESV